MKAVIILREVEIANSRELNNTRLTIVTKYNIIFADGEIMLQDILKVLTSFIKHSYICLLLYIETLLMYSFKHAVNLIERTGRYQRKENYNRSFSTVNNLSITAHNKSLHNDTSHLIYNRVKDDSQDRRFDLPS